MFVARRSDDQTRPWPAPRSARLVNLAEGPYGALYVREMHRNTIEHPDYLPVQIGRYTDFDSGKGLAVFWRISATDPAPSIRRSWREPAPACRSTERRPGDCAINCSTTGWRARNGPAAAPGRRDPAAVPAAETNRAMPTRPFGTSAELSSLACCWASSTSKRLAECLASSRPRACASKRFCWPSRGSKPRPNWCRPWPPWRPIPIRACGLCALTLGEADDPACSIPWSRSPWPVRRRSLDASGGGELDCRPRARFSDACLPPSPPRPRAMRIYCPSWPA